MANKELKSIKFPGLSDVYTIPEGTQGKDGITPTIGENGNWYLGETDTGKPSRGATGDKGEKGEPGAAGSPGKDGVSPVITISKSGKVTTVTVTDASGTQSFEVLDGEDGQDLTPLPTVTASDNGKFLRVVNGAWAAASVPDASGVSF